MALGRALEAKGHEVFYQKVSLLPVSAEAHHVERPQYGLGGFRLKPMRFVENMNGAYVFRDTDFIGCMPYRPEVFDLKGEVLLQGHWQCAKYFEAIAADLRAELVPVSAPTPEIAALLEKIRRERNSIALHIRRGDNLLERSLKYHGYLPDSYYEQAIRYVAERYPNPKVFIFSDDPDWCRENIKWAETVSTTDRWWDLYLIGECQHAIIANSTFSWWGAWRGDYKSERIVIGPKRWFVTPELDARDIIPERWLRL